MAKLCSGKQKNNMEKSATEHTIGAQFRWHCGNTPSPIWAIKGPVFSSFQVEKMEPSKCRTVLNDAFIKMRTIWWKVHKVSKVQRKAFPIARKQILLGLPKQMVETAAEERSEAALPKRRPLGWPLSCHPCISKPFVWITAMHCLFEGQCKMLQLMSQWGQRVENGSLQY